MSRAGFAAAVASWALSGQAQPAPEAAVRFRYEAPAACPSAEVFTARVRERTTRGREAEPEELARTFTVGIAPDATGFLGSIEFVDDAGVSVSRRVHGEECDAVVSSLALITALALDVQLREEGAEQPELSSAPVSSRPTPPPPEAPPARPAAAAPIPPRRTPSPPWLSSARLGVAAAYESTIPAPVFALLGQLDFRGSWSLRLMPHYESRDIEVSSGREVSVRVIGLETSVCPVRFHAADVALTPCAAFDLGSLRARGVPSDELVATSSETMLWAALAAELRLAWEPQQPFWLELRGALDFPLVRHEFRLENPTQTAFEIAGMSTLAGVSGGVRFW